MAKRLFDFILSNILLILLSPFFIIITILIKIDSRGPVFFLQDRVGKDGRIFKICKFRTMIESAEKKFKLEINKDNIDDFIFQKENDPRVTRLGKFLRKISLDEIPQLINVAKGEMSFVGPRPEIPEIVRYYRDEYKKRLKVKPGLTGLAQIKGRGDITLGQVIEYDLEYLKRKSFFFDMKILLDTLIVVFTRKGAK